MRRHRRQRRILRTTTPPLRGGWMVWVGAPAIAILLWLAGLPVAAQEPAAEPLYLQEPFDQITLNEHNNNTVLKVLPSVFPDRRRPDPAPKKLMVRLVERPETEYELQWNAIAKIELFEEILLAEADRLGQAGQFDQAYDYFRFMEESNWSAAELKEALAKGLEKYLAQQSQMLESKGLTANALAALYELHRRNPNYPQLDEQLGSVIDKRVEEYLAAGNQPAARRMLRSLMAIYPQQAVVRKWESRWTEEAGRLLQEARSQWEAGQLPAAEQACRRAVETWPDLPGVQELAKAIHEKYPRIVVGVMSSGRVLEPGAMDDWAARRSSRLVYRTLVEFLGPGTDGGKYRCPVGELKVEQLGRRLAFRLKPDQRWSRGDTTLTGTVLARRLLALADPNDDAYRREWSELLEQVSAPGVYEAYADLTRPHVRPQAFLQTTLVPYGDPALAQGGDWLNGPYVVESQSDDQVVYVANPVVPSAAGQPKQVVERYFERGGRAVESLKRREIDLVDRVNPWAVDGLRREKNLVVEPYGVPLVHCLIPNRKRLLTGNRTFRRALAYGLDREAILQRLVGGRVPDGSQVISGPFSAGTSLQDPLAYAYDESLLPRAYDPRLAISLAEVARRELAEQNKDQPLATLPPLVLAHPPGELCTVACTMIKKQLKLLGIQVNLQVLPPEATDPVPDEVDLVYAELAMWEPIADARRLLAASGPAGDCSPYMTLALRQLEQATDWQEAGTKLRQIHRLAYDDVAVVPLWQLVDYFARHKSLEGVGKRPVSLYQDVEVWKPGLN